MADEDGAGLRDRLSKQGEEALGKLASDLLENPLINSAITRAFSAREKAVQRAGGRDGRAQPAVGRRHRPAHPPAADRGHPAGGDRGVARPAPRRRRQAHGKLEAWTATPASPTGWRRRGPAVQARERGRARVGRDRRGSVARSRASRSGSTWTTLRRSPPPQAGSKEEVLDKVRGHGQEGQEEGQEGQQGCRERRPRGAARRGRAHALSVRRRCLQATRERTREIVDEIAAAAGRVRNTLEDMRVLDEVKRLRSEVESLAARVASLEIKPGGRCGEEPRRPRQPRGQEGAAQASRRRPSARRRSPRRAKPVAKPAATAAQEAGRDAATRGDEARGGEEAGGGAQAARSRRKQAGGREEPAAATPTAAPTSRRATPAEAPPGAPKPRRPPTEAAGRRELLSVSAPFESAKELREVIDQVFSMMDADPDMGPKLRDADTPQRFEFTRLRRGGQHPRDARGRGGQPALGVVRRRRLEVQGPDDDVLGGRQPLLPGQGERRRWRSRAGGSRRAGTSRPRSR